MADLRENCRGLIGLLTVLGALLLGVRAQQQEFRLVGGDVTLVPKYTGDIKEITWTLNGRIFVEIILKPQEEFTYNLTNDRATINKTNGALTIRYLTTGDSGLYEANVILMDNSVKITKIRLTVHDCPDQPIISVQSTKDQFVVSCKSFSPDVTYEWFNQTRSVSKSQLYTEPKKNGTLTCVVDNGVCNKRSSINFYTPEEKSVGDNVTLVPKYTGDPSEIIWKVNGSKLVKMVLKPRGDRKFYRLEDRAIISDTDGSLTIWKLTREDSGNYTAVVLVNNEYYYTEIRLTVLESSHPSVWSIIGIVIGVLTLITIIHFIIIILWYRCYKKSSRLPEGIIAGKVFVVVTLIAMINLIFLLWYYGYKKSSRLSGGDVFPVVVGVLLLIPILITIFLLQYYYYYTKKIKRRERLILEMKNSTSKVVEDKREEESEKCITVEFRNDYTSPSDESRGLLENRLLTLCNMEAGEDVRFTAEVVFDKKKGDGMKNKEKESDPKIHVKELVWKKDGVTIFKWANSSLKFLTSNIKLKPGSVTVYDAEGKKSYRVFFQLEEPPESMSICCITFHPIKMTGKDKITWKKDSQPVYIGGDRITCEPNGDLTIYNPTFEDEGKYTVQCIDNEEDQEFILHL